MRCCGLTGFIAEPSRGQATGDRVKGLRLGEPFWGIREPMERENRYSDKEHREVEHIIESEEERGYSPDEAERIGYATVNKRRSEAEESEETSE
jgi:hypothetical protein